MKAVVVFLSLFLATAALAASDYAREKKWADEILPSVLVGDAVWLDEADGHTFLSLYTEAAGAKTAVILGHGIGVHPDWGVIGVLRQSLAEKGYTTLSVQLPVLAADARADVYVPTFDAAAARLGKAVAYLKARGYTRIALVSHSLGCRMSYRYLSGSPDASVKTWVAMSTPGGEDFGKLKLPVLDLYGQNDLPGVVKNAELRAAGPRPAGSTQLRLKGADHFFEGMEAALLEQISGHLKTHL